MRCVSSFDRSIMFVVLEMLGLVVCRLAVLLVTLICFDVY